MKPAPFAYAKARSLDHAVTLLRENESARVLAGGQSLMATLNMRLDAPKLLVDINGLPDLDRIEVNGSHVEIGPLVRYAAAIRSPLIGRHVPLLAMALPHIGHAAIRNRGTIGGSIAFADPAAELPACLLALGGEVKIEGAAGTRIIAADEFFRGLFDTAIEADELLTGVRLPVAAAEMRYGFAELSRRHGDYAIVGLAASAKMTGSRLENVRLAFFGIGATPMRSRAAETALGKGASGEHLETAVAALADDLTPSDDIHARAKTRLHLAGVLLKRVVAQMLGQTS